MSQQSLAPLEATAEISALIETLVQTERRLAELTAGEVDTVADQEGRTLMLRRSQDALRDSEAVKQGAILNALPANIAVLDAHGVIVAVNESWRSFGVVNALLSPENGVGINYLDVCDVDSTEEASEASQVAAGIRSVLSGRTQGFFIEYPCHSPLVQRWFLLTVTPLSEERANGAVVMHLDVTAERLAAKSLEASESRFRQMADHITDVFFLQNLDNTEIYYVSPAYEQIWGRSCESLYANPMSWTDAVHPDDLQHAITRVSEDGKAGFEHEYRIIRPDGEIRWIHVREFVVLDAADKPYRTAGVCTDITERKLAADELRASEARFRSLADLSSDWYWEQDEEHRFLSFPDNEVRKKLGIDPVSSIGKCRWDFPGSTPLQGSWEEHKALLDARKAFRNFEFRRPGENGGYRYFATSGEPVFDVGGRFTGYRGVGTDITERIEAAQSLRESERRFSDLLGSVQLVSLMVDDQARITYCNDYLLNLTGWRREEIIGRNAFDVLIPPDSEDMAGAFASLLAGQLEARHRENEIMTRTGERRLIRWNNSVLRSGTGEVIGSASIGEDITESQRAKEEILRLNADLERRVNERTAELEAANRELEAFDYSVAHDLRAPIRHIEGFSSMLLEEYGDKLDVRGREYLEKLQGAGKKMELLVGDLLALSLISRSNLNRSDVDLSALAQTVFANLQEAEPERDIQCVIMPGINVNADVGLLRIVLENLIGNAWKFTGKQPGAKIEFGCALQDSVPAFFVRDNGAGFDQGYADRLFAPFQRLHAQSEFKGTGIGLATVSRIITRHGGKVWAEGIVNHGATFHFTLAF